MNPNFSSRETLTQEAQSSLNGVTHIKCVYQFVSFLFKQWFKIPVKSLIQLVKTLQSLTKDKQRLEEVLHKPSTLLKKDFIADVFL